MAFSLLTKKIAYIIHGLGISSNQFGAVYKKCGKDVRKTIKYFSNSAFFSKSKKLQHILHTAKKHNIDLFSIADSQYPPSLNHIHHMAPLLFYKGKNIIGPQPKVAVVGTRCASAYGKRAAAYFGRQLSMRDITVVSGMAAGIDCCAQKAALAEKGGSIGVLGAGIGYVYPPANRSLYREILDRGGLLSEYIPFSVPKKRNFPQRNRLISGLCLGVVIIESKSRGGALITANLALEQGKEVFAVPGSIFSKNSRGTNRLIQQGAKLVSRIDDVLEEICALAGK